MEKRSGGARAHEPRLRVDPLEDRGPDVADGVAFGGRFTTAGGRDLPRQPEEKRGAAPVEYRQQQRRLEHEAAQSERHEEHHQPHPRGDAEEAWEPLQDARVRAGRRQHDVARTWRDGGHDREKKKGHGLLSRRTLPPGRILMRSNITRSGGEGLERSCARTITSWIASRAPADGVELFRAWFAGEAYQKHRHDTYAIGLTDRGVQLFDYRGSVRTRIPRQVVVLYPDEVHDGRAGTEEGFGYRIVYVEPSRLAEALRVLHGRSCPLPFAAEPVSRNAKLSRAVEAAFLAPSESLAMDSLVVDLAEGLMAEERGGVRRIASRHVDVRVVDRARAFLDAERTRVVHSAELETITGLTRYDLARQFRI